MEISDAIRRTILRYSMLSPGDRLAAAVSAGADSVALLHLLHRLAPELGVHLEVLHVNHHLRGAESNADAAFVQAQAAALGLPCHVEDAPVDASANIEEAAREARHACYQKGGRKVATAHTRDDQAETVLLRLLRGAGLAGLAGILPVTREGLIRPALDVSREDLRAWAREQGLTWREDSSNASQTFARNRLRAHLLPQLQRDWNPALPDLLARTATLAREDHAFLEEESARRHRALDRRGVLDIHQLLAEPEAMKTRIVRHALAAVKGDLRAIGFEHVERILALARAPEGDGRLQVPGVDVFRSFQWLRFAPWPPQEVAPRNWTIPITGPGQYAIPHTPVTLVLEPGERAPANGVYNKDTVRIGWSEADATELVLRNWRPGDAYRPLGSDEVRKIKLLFQQSRIPLWDRRNWPILARKGTIVWTRHFGVSADCPVPPDAPFLVLRECS